MGLQHPLELRGPLPAVRLAPHQLPHSAVGCLDAGPVVDTAVHVQWQGRNLARDQANASEYGPDPQRRFGRSEEHTSELQSLMRISYAVFCLKKKKTQTH